MANRYTYWNTRWRMYAMGKGKNKKKKQQSEREHLIHDGKAVAPSQTNQSTVSVKVATCDGVGNDKAARVTRKAEYQGRTDIPTITSEQILLTNRPAFIQENRCPQCGEPVRQREVYVRGRYENQTYGWCGYTKALRFCCRCECYYISPDVLSEKNHFVRLERFVKDYIWPSNVRRIIHLVSHTPIYVPGYKYDADEKHQRAGSLYDVPQEDLAIIASGKFRTPDWKDRQWWGTEAQENDDKTLYVHRGYIVCMRQHHLCESATAILKNGLGRDVKLNVTHCLLCDKYFIHNDNYERYRNMYGLILGQIRFVEHDIGEERKRSEMYEMNLREESTLHLFGYNVQKRSHLTMVERQLIIVNVIEMKAMTKHEVINLLTNLIRRNKSKVDAVNAWSEDLEFVQDYDIDKQRRVDVRRIVPYCRNRFVALHKPISTQSAVKQCSACRFSEKYPGKTYYVCTNPVTPQYQNPCMICDYYDEC